MADDSLLIRLTVQALASSAFSKTVFPAAAAEGVVVDADADVDGTSLSPSIDRVENELPGAPIEVQVVKKRRGRPPRNPTVAVASTAAVVVGSCGTAAITAMESKRRKKVKEEKEDEDVCFICFDGGSLVLCDHRDCPKAYHPACVKRDESYFIPSIRWECGWHLCNICLKNAIFLCYTCPYSLCKGCVKEADIFCVRDNKGFCKTCMSTVMLIEKIPQENNELPQVDFDDTTCWEYLFKVYWILLKKKEALTLDELIRASNPWKASALEQKTHDTYISNSTHLAANTLKRRKTRKAQPPQPLQPPLTIDSQKIVKSGSNKVPGLLGRPDWASKELLEFVAYMKNGDISSVSEFDVQALLLDYIKNNNLRDPRQKCQIICDKRLENLFGKDRVGHFEMLKLLEYHFKEESSSNGVIHGAAVGSSGLLEEGTTVDIQTSCRNTRQQSRRNGDEGDRRIDPNAYAAIDTHNINLIYLKRSLLETLTVDAEKFHDKVVGSVVRIKLSNNDQKQDMHRLVRIIGSSKATQPYKIGDKMENLMLKILNLNKIEDVRIDAISDQEFSEDECRRLRQSIKLGLVERMTVGEIQEKAMVLQAVRVSDSLETEIRRLIHLRDRASEMGRRKELREYVEKIELLRTPEECQRRIRVPEVHADPRMDPSCGSDDESGESDMKRRDVALTPKYSKSYSKSMELVSPCGVGNMSKDDRARTLKAAAENGERKRKYSDKFHVVKVEDASGSLDPPHKTERPDAASRVLERDSRTDSSVISGDHGVAAFGSISQCNSDPSRAAPKGMLVVSDVSELEKIWYYQDPLGKVQGPFCMLQLRKWDSNDFFPNDLKVWRTDETCDQSILLKDALKKQKSGEPHFVQRSCMQSHDGAKIDDGKVNSIGVMNSNSVTSWVSDQTNEECSKSNMTDTACTPEVIEQSVNGYSSQFLKAQLIDSLFNIEEPGSDSTAERSPEMMHVNLKSESSRPLNDTSMSAKVYVISPAVKSGPPSPNAGRPDSGTSLDIASEGIEASDLPGSMPVSNHENTKDLHVDDELQEKSDVCKEFNVSCGSEAGVIKISDVPASLPKTQFKDKNDHDTIDSWVGSAVSGGTNVSGLPSAAPKMENYCMKYHEAEYTHPISLDVPGGNSGTGRSVVSCGIDVSLLTRITPNEEIKANAVENKCHAGSNVPQQDSGTSPCSVSGEIMVSDLPNTSPKSQTDGLQTSVAESIGFPTPNILGQDSGVSWSNMTGGIGFSINATTLKLDADASRGIAVENDHCPPQYGQEQDSGINWTNPSSIGAEIDLSDIGNDWDWQPIEFSTLGDDSVSDLLSEVEAMEALRGMSSPIPEMNCADDSIGSPGDNCFSPLGGLNLNLDLGKNDAFTADIQFHMQPNHRDQPHASFNVDVSDIPGTSGILSTLGPTTEAISKPVTASAPHHNFVSLAHASLLPPPPPVPDLNCVSQASLSLSPPPASLPLHNFVSQAPQPLSLAPSPLASPLLPTPVLPTPPPAASKSPSLAAADSKSPLPPPAATKLPSPPPSSPQLPLAPIAAKAHSLSPNPAAVAAKTYSASPKQAAAAEKSLSPSPQPSILSLHCPSNPEEGREVDTSIPAHQGVTPHDQRHKRTSSIEFLWKQGSETTTSGWEPPGQPTGKFSGTGSSLGSPTMHQTTSGQVTPSVGANSPRSNSVVTSPRYNHNVGRQPGPKDRSHHYNNGTDSGFGKSRPTSWNKPSSFGARGGPLRPGPTTRGQRVCKFHESGHCRKGASCMYLHP